MGLNRFLFSSLILSGLAVLPAPGFAADPLSDKLLPRAEVSVKGGSERSVLTTEFWAPLAQQSGKVVYTDLRLMGDDDDNREGNLGIGYRQTVPQFDSILGGHLWIDRRRTEQNSTFHQVTFGLESLGKVIDLRANGYIPLNSTHSITTPNIGSLNPYLAGNGLFYDTNGSISETPQYGVDAEIGYRLPVLQKYADTIRVYGGSYSFFRNDTDSVTGYRIRTEAVINPVLSVGARFQHDGPRGDQGFLEATIRFPFSAKKMYQQKGLYGRLDESPERDIDIVTSAKIDTGLKKPVLNSSGTQQHIIYVDNTNANTGNGSKENPFNNLTSAQAALKANDILYVFRGDGTTHNMDQGITISQSNVSLIGSGSALTLSGITFLQAGQAPVITNTQALGDGVFFNNVNASVSGITVQNALRDGIRVVADNASIGNVTISNVTTNGNAGRGIFVLANNNASIDTVTVSNSTANNSYAVNSGDFANGVRARGIEVSSFNNSIINTVIEDKNTVVGNRIEGMVAQAQFGARLQNAYITNNTLSSNGGNITVQAASQGSLDYALIKNNVASNVVGTSSSIVVIANAGVINSADIISNQSINNSSGYGLTINATTSGTIGNINVSDLIANNNAAGVYVLGSANGVIGNLNASNIITNNNINGVQIILNAATVNNASFNNLTASGNTGYGLYTYNQTGLSTLRASVANSNLTGNTIYGAYLRRGDPASTFIVDLGGGALNSTGNNRIFGNTGNDLNVDNTAVFAKNNWWGINSAPTRVNLTNGATLNATPFLSTDPRP